MLSSYLSGGNVIEIDRKSLVCTMIMKVGNGQLFWSDALGHDHKYGDGKLKWVEMYFRIRCFSQLLKC
jgi:hypothetical protein